MVWAEIITIFIGLLAVTAYIIIWAVMNKKAMRIDVARNLPICMVFGRNQFTDGYFTGLLKRQRPAKNGCSLIEMYPIDEAQGENKAKPELQSFVVKDEFIKPYPRMKKLSTRREIVFFVSRSPADLPSKMRDTTEGKWMIKEGQLAHLESIFKKAIPGGDEAINEMVENWARGQMSKGTIKQMKEEMKVRREVQTDQETKEIKK